MLGCFLFNEFKTFNESRSLPESARMSSTYLKENPGLLGLYSFNHLAF